MRFEAVPRVWREIERAPKDVGQWAMGWVQAAQKPGATFAEVTEGASPLKGGDFRNCYVRKWRRRVPHGEYRLVFYADGEKVIFASLEPRGDDYKVARRRIRALPR